MLLRASSRPLDAVSVYSLHMTVLGQGVVVGGYSYYNVTMEVRDRNKN